MVLKRLTFSCFAGFFFVSSIACNKGGGGSSSNRGATDTPASESLEVPVENKEETQKTTETAKLTENEGVSEKLSVRPALTLSIATLTGALTEFDQFDDNKFVWNPANAPLDKLNEIICVVANTGFNIFPNQSSKYVAKINLKDCFSSGGSGDSGTNGDSNGGSNKKDKVVVQTTKNSTTGYIDVKVWFDRIFDHSTAHEAGFYAAMFDSELKVSYYIEAQFQEIPSKDNPFGQFDLKWQTIMYLDGVAADTPVQEGFVDTYKENGNSLLKFNQQNANITYWSCDNRASATLNGIVFMADNMYAQGNTISLALNTTETLGVQIANYNTSNGSNTINAYPSLDPEQYVPEAGNASFQNGVDNNTSAELVYGAIRMFGSNYAKASQYNGLSMSFDGTKTLATVVAEWEAANNLIIDPYFSFDTNLYTPSSVQTLNFSGGVDEVQASATYTTATVTANDYGTNSNGIALEFDGLTTVEQAVTNHNTISPYKQVTCSGDCTVTPPDGTTMTLSGGAGAPSDRYADIIEFMAHAKMNLSTGKPTSGSAHTAQRYKLERQTQNCAAGYSGWSDQSGSYGMAFDRNDQGTGATDGRSGTKYFNDSGYSYSAAGDYNPEDLRCEQMGGELASVWSYAIFDPATGKQIHHRTSFPLFFDGSSNPWGDGWASSWGISLWGNFNDGDSVYYKDETGNKVYLTVIKYPGELIDQNWKSVNASVTTDMAFDCTERCPIGEVTQAQADNSWDLTTFPANKKYIFKADTKTLYYDANADGVYDGGDIPINFAAGVDGWMEVELTETSSSDSYRYNFSTWNSPVGLKKSDNSMFIPPSEIVFDKNMKYTHSTMAYPGTENIAENAAWDGKTFAEIINPSDPSSAMDLTYAWGNICCFGWEEKAGFTDEWGNAAWASQITLKKGVVLNIVGDPDGDGPLGDSITSVKIAPEFTELRPKTVSDCSAGLGSIVDDINPKTGSNSLPLPAALSASERDVKGRLGAKPADKDLPQLVEEGKAIQ